MARLANARDINKKLGAKKTYTRARVRMNKKLKRKKPRDTEPHSPLSGDDTVNHPADKAGIRRIIRRTLRHRPAHLLLSLSISLLSSLSAGRKIERPKATGKSRAKHSEKPRPSHTVFVWGFWPGFDHVPCKLPT